MTQTSVSVPTTTVASYSIAGGTYFYDTSGTYSMPRPFSQQSSFSTIPQSANPQIRPAVATQIHGKYFVVIVC